MTGIPVRAVSSPTGSLLLVFVVVVVGTPVVLFGLTFTDSLDSGPPTTEFETETAGGNVSIVPVTGDSLDPSNLVVRRNGETVRVSTLVSDDSLTAGESIPVPPSGADELRLVWRDGGESYVLHTVTEYTVTRTLGFAGERPQTVAVDDVDTVRVELSGAGGENAEYADGARGGYVAADVNVSGVDAVTVYVAESPESTNTDPVGGWGWRDGGAPGATTSGPFVGGGGGGATAVLVGGRPVVVADGGGGGTDWDTFSFYPGGGGARGGLGGRNGFSTGRAESGDGTGDGGDGAGGTSTGDLGSLVQATAGGAAVLDPANVTDVAVESGGGAAPDRNATVRVTYGVG